MGSLRELLARHAGDRLCVKQSATQTWGSPVLGTNGLSAGLPYPAMSRIISIDPGTLDFRAVMPDGLRHADWADLTQQTINAHGTYTLTAVGCSRSPSSVPRPGPP